MKAGLYGFTVFDASLRRIGFLDTRGVKWAVNITPDGQKVVAGFGDGILRWYKLKVRQLSHAERMRYPSSVRTPARTISTLHGDDHSERINLSKASEGTISELVKLMAGVTNARDVPSVIAELVELLALYALPDGRWVLWTPSGYYQASPGAEDLIGWHVNNGVDKAPDFFPASRFRDQFYRPDIIARILETGDEHEALRLADQARGKRTIIQDVRTLRPPVISILAPVPGEKVTERKLTLTYEAHSVTGPITNIEARVGARSARVLQHVPDYRDNRLAVIGQITVEIPPADTVVEVLASNQNGPSESAKYRVNWSGTADFFKPDLYVLAVGVSDYAADENDLKYAAKDARDFVRAIRRQEGEIYKRVYIKLLDEKQATREAILDGLDWIDRETTSRDVAVVYLAGHGVNDTQGRYRFLPVDYEQGRLSRTTVTGAELKEFLQGVAGKTVLFFDTCYSGNALAIRAGSKPDVDRVANELADADVGVVVFASTTQGGLARGLDDIQQGAFTKALIEGIETGKAGLTKDLFVSVAELEKYISDRVKELTKGEQKPVTTKPKAVEDWDFIRVPD